MYASNSYQPFLALSKSATSPRAAADLVTRATSAPNTYLFAELLQTPAIQSLSSNAEFAGYLTLLQIFSYGTCAIYRETPDLPALSEAQTLKLRQLSLLTLVRDRSNLSYEALQKALDLPAARDVEDIVISAVYAGLLNATLDPARATVHVSSVAPLRDLSPGAIPDMISVLQTWADRCTTTLGSLDEQMKDIRATAALRQREKRVADDKIQKLMAEMADPNSRPGTEPRHTIARRGYNKRPVMDVPHLTADEYMDLDDPPVDDDASRRASKRKL